MCSFTNTTLCFPLLQPGWVYAIIAVAGATTSPTPADVRDGVLPAAEHQEDHAHLDIANHELLPEQQPGYIAALMKQVCVYVYVASARPRSCPSGDNKPPSIAGDWETRAVCCHFNLQPLSRNQVRHIAIGSTLLLCAVFN